MTSSQTSVSETVTAETAGETALAWLRRQLPDHSWSACRKVLVARRVRINGVVTVHEGRRLAVGDVIELSATATRAPTVEQITLRHLDADLLVVEKPAGIETTRRPEEAKWPLAKRLLQPTLDELAAIASLRRRPGDLPQILPQLFRVQRLDRETSGLVVFARTKTAAKGLVPQFAEHTATRIYHAVVIGNPSAQIISTGLVRDRGDGLRGSPSDQRGGLRAVTHVRPLEPLGHYTLVECRLETGRTHQIRIHLAEQGHPVCGDSKYQQRRDGTNIPDDSDAPRLALHAAHLSFSHPRTGAVMEFHADWPMDLTAWLDKLRQLAASSPTAHG